MIQSLLTRIALPAMVAGALAGSGCVSAVTVRIPNPLVSGGVSANRVPNADLTTANYYGLPPGTFTSEASMVSLDAQRACFIVTVRQPSERGNLAALGAWRVFLRGAPRIENMNPIFGPPAAQSVAAMQGSVPRRIFAGYSTYCGRYGCSTSPRYVTVREPAIINVVTGGGAVCFAHGGAVNPRTEEVTLHLDDPTTVSRRLAFRWRFN